MKVIEAKRDPLWGRGGGLPIVGTGEACTWNCHKQPMRRGCLHLRLTGDEIVISG